MAANRRDRDTDSPVVPPWLPADAHDGASDTFLPNRLRSNENTAGCPEQAIVALERAKRIIDAQAVVIEGLNESNVALARRVAELTTDVEVRVGLVVETAHRSVADIVAAHEATVAELLRPADDDYVESVLAMQCGWIPEAAQWPTPQLSLGDRDFDPD
jgi:hypothetical protein